METSETAVFFFKPIQIKAHCHSHDHGIGHGHDVACSILVFYISKKCSMCLKKLSVQNLMFMCCVSNHGSAQTPLPALVLSKFDTRVLRHNSLVKFIKS